MKVLQINGVSGTGSTGKICESISDLLTREKIDNKILYYHGHSDHPLSVRMRKEGYYKIQALKSRILGNYGFNSDRSTNDTIDIIEHEDPDLINIHNIHGHEVNIEKLFNYLTKRQIPVVWTMHDCWAITGYCPYFTIVKCDRWRTKCNSCPQRRTFSWFFDRSGSNQEKKKKAAENLNLTVVTPSAWLANIMRESFLEKFPVKVINNGIEQAVFQPRESDFKKIHNCDDKIILLGVANGWGNHKGLDIFLRLNETLSKGYQIVLVGTDDEVKRTLPKDIIAINRTNDQIELAQIYSAADIFINPTREDNYPTVNMEAVSCGTPVITFRTGGSPEMVDDTCGSVVDVDDFEGMVREIERYGKKTEEVKRRCMTKSMQFHAEDRFREYVELYREILGRK